MLCVYSWEARNGTQVAKSLIGLREKRVVCLSVELQQIECALMHDANELYVTADRGHILIVRGLMSHLTALKERLTLTGLTLTSAFLPVNLFYITT